METNQTIKSHAQEPIRKLHRFSWPNQNVSTRRDTAFVLITHACTPIQVRLWDLIGRQNAVITQPRYPVLNISASPDTGSIVVVRISILAVL